MPDSQASNAAPKSERPSWKGRRRTQIIADVRLLSYADNLESIARRIGLKPKYLREVLRGAGELALLEAITIDPMQDPWAEQDKARGEVAA